VATGIGLLHVPSECQSEAGIARKAGSYSGLFMPNEGL
jgi:hypothetical protein